jgi:tetratricopeptide (TPR) repeat protein
LVKNGINVNQTIEMNYGAKNITALDIVFINIYDNRDQTKIDKLEKQAEYLKSIGVRPMDISICTSLAEGYYWRNQTKKALEMYLIAIDIDSKYLANYYKIGEIYQSMGEYEKSKKYLDKVITRADTKHSIFYKQAVNHYYLNEFNKAMENLEKSSVFSDKDIIEKIIEAYIGEFDIQKPQEYFKIANLYRKIDNKQKADEYLEKFREAQKKRYAK